jgi:flagellar biosynthetic protein FliQ
MEAKLIGLAVDTFEIVLQIALPILFVAMVVGLLVSIFQATTQINEMTLTFVPKILAVIAVMVLLMPWMIRIMVEFTTKMFNSMDGFMF